jgi:peptide/nickel transport system substrate-binding protein
MGAQGSSAAVKSLAAHLDAKASSVQAPIRGGTLKLGAVVPPSTIDPVLSSDPTGLGAVQLVNEYLFDVETDSSLRPVLGLSASVDSSKLVWTVPLRRGVTFNDGTPFTAAAVVSSFRRLIAPNSESSAAATFVDILQSVVQLDKHTVQFKLSRPFSDFPYLLSSGNYNTFILPPTYGGSWLRTPVGTGAFRLISNVTDQRLTYMRRSDYWNEREIYLDAVDVLLYESDQSLLLALESGEIDAEASSIATDAANINKAKINVEASASSAFADLALRVDRPPFNDKSVRQAVAWALDRSAINSVQLEADGALGNDHVFAPVFKVRPQGLAQRQKSLGKVKSLLAGRTISFTITGPDYEVAFATQLQQQLNAAGFKVDLNTLTDAAYYAGSNSTTPWLNAEATLTSWTAYPSASELLSYMYKTGGVWNASHYSNPTLDKLSVDYDAANTEARQQQLVNEMGRILWEDVPVILPVWQPSVRFAANQVHGLGSNSALDLTGVWIGK